MSKSIPHLFENGSTSFIHSWSFICSHGESSRASFSSLRSISTTSPRSKRERWYQKVVNPLSISGISIRQLRYHGDNERKHDLLLATGSRQSWEKRRRSVNLPITSPTAWSNIPMYLLSRRVRIREIGKRSYSSERKVVSELIEIVDSSKVDIPVEEFNSVLDEEMDRVKKSTRDKVNLAGIALNRLKQASKRLSMSKKDGKNVKATNPKGQEVDEVDNSDDFESDREGLVGSGEITAGKISIKAIKPLREAKVASLGRQLWRVLFNSGVHSLRDPRTGVWNYSPALGRIPKPEEFAFDRCPPYITASKDEELMQMTEIHNKPFVGSTSTLTKALSQIYFALSGWKDVNLSTLSQDFASERTDFTAGAKLPACLIIQRLSNGRYAVDNDKRYDVEENVLSDYGRILEKLLTTEHNDFGRFLKISPESAVPESERNAREAYHYSKSDKLIMRSQLDCHDPRLPGTGTFDIKTRACVTIRHDRANYLESSAYDIHRERGYKQSFEREYYDLIRSGMLKFSFQARIGNMDGIFLAYHNTKRLFGFQYLPLSELDERLFGSTEMANQAFKLCVRLLEELLDQAVKAFPDTSLSLVIKSHPTPSSMAHRVTAWVQPQQSADSPEGEVPIHAITLTINNYLDGEPCSGPIDLTMDPKTKKIPLWGIRYTLHKSGTDPESQKAARKDLSKAESDLYGMTSLATPEGKTSAEMIELEEMKMKAKQEVQSSADDGIVVGKPAKIRWRAPDERIRSLRREAKESGLAYEARKKGWRRHVANQMAAFDVRLKEGDSK